MADDSEHIMAAYRVLDALPLAAWQHANRSALDTALRALGEPRVIFPLIRRALTGDEPSLPIADSLWAIGRGESLRRLRAACRP